MKKVLLFITVICNIFVLFTFSSKKINGVYDLDVIEDYIITVEPDFHDGSLRITTELNWHVLNDSIDGPLSWIKIGVPNYHVENLKALTTNIKQIKYYEDSGSFIKITLDRNYYRDEIVEMKFSWVQTHMYFLDGNIVRYDYNPGYFEEIKVNNCVVRWQMKNVAEVTESSLSPTEENGYYVWSSSLSYNQYIKVNLFYNKMDFLELDPNKQFTNRYVSNKTIISTCVIFGSLTLIVIGLIFYSRSKQDPYLRERGFIVYHHFHIFSNRYPSHYYGSGVSKEGTPINPPVSVSGGGHYGGVGGCACACACACAGGGRAGCSMKDFYHTNLSSSNVIKIIEESNK